MTVRRIVLLGATASGKTELSLRLAEKLGTSIVSVDARQSYKYLDIGTAKVTPEQRKRVPHFNLDVHDPSERDSPYDFLSRVESWEAHHMSSTQSPPPMLYVGGSTLYLTSIITGLDNLPKANEDRVVELGRRADAEGLESLYQELQAVDPKYATKMDGLNRQRLIRALDVYHETGKPFSSFHTQETPHCPKDMLVFGIGRARTGLHERINRRVDHMIQQGLEEEVSTLLAMGYTQDSPGLQTVGYSELLSVHKGALNRKEAIEKIKTNTRRYAKRQETWFRKWPFIQWLDADRMSLEDMLHPIIKLLNP